MNPIKILNIESPDNALFKRLKRVLDVAGIKKEGLFMVSGKKIVLEALKESSIVWEQLIIRHNDDLADLQSHTPSSATTETGSFAHPSLRIAQMSSNLFSELDVFGTNYPLLFGQLPEIKSTEEKNLKAPDGMEVILPFSDPSNLGAAIRTCVALGVRQIYLTKESAHPYHAKSIRASSGTVWHTSFLRLPSVHQICVSTHSIITFALDMNGENIYNSPPPQNFRMLIGEEGQGIPGNYTGPRLKIPISPRVDSLNATTALTIGLALAQAQTQK